MEEIIKGLARGRIARMKAQGIQDCRDLGHDKCPPEDCPLCRAILGIDEEEADE